jgi:hypothetical protein
MRALATYEAPYVGMRPGKGGRQLDYLADLERLRAQGKRPQMAGYFMVQMVGGPWFLPLMMRMMPKVWKHLDSVAPTIVYDTRVMGAFEVPVDVLKRVPVPTIAIAGSKGAPAMLAAQEKIAAVVPGAEHRVLEGQTHQVSPQVLGPVLADFFARHRSEVPPRPAQF